MIAVVVAIGAILLGGLLVFRGYPAMRLTVGLIGGFVGFLLGATIASVVVAAGETSLAGWIGGIVGAIIVGALAFAVYRIAIIVGVGALGFTVGTAVAEALAIPDGGVIIVGIIAAIVLVIVGFAMDLPGLLIVILTSLAGADLMVTGVRVLIADVTIAESADRVLVWTDPSALWSIITIALAIVGIVAQRRYARGAARSARSQWVGATQTPTTAKSDFR